METQEQTLFDHLPTANQWKRIGVKKHHGFVIPLFSLHSAQSCGIGEYLDLIPIIDWCASLGYDVIQLLPLNDTGLDPSPYSALSAFALNPIHITLASLPYLQEEPKLLEAYQAIPKINTSNKIDYVEVRKHKHTFLYLYFQTIGKKIISTDDYQNFITQTKWLKEYALYKTLKVINEWKDWESWPQEYQNPTVEQLEEFYVKYKEAIEWHSFLQYLSHNQLLKVSQYGQEKKVFLMGDIPILIGRDSADTWLHRELFNMDYSAGAPPDIYNSEGQKWGFPIYNWDVMAMQGYAWWINRIQTASQYYQIYRIDHIVGLFRIWAIPLPLMSKDGFFIPNDSVSLLEQGKRILQMMINSCSMLPIGEDLGTIPKEVRSCLNELGICGTRVIRWEREWEQERQPFIPLENYAKESLTTVSTHDSETISLWWQNRPEDTKAYAEFKGWCYHPTLSRSYHQEILWDSHHSNSLFHINLLQEYLSLVPGLTWPTLEDERINIPGTISDSNWSYRFRPSIDELIENHSLKHSLKEIIS